MLRPLAVLVSHLLAPPPDSVQSHVLNPGPQQLHYLSVGTPGAGKPTVLLVHGSPGDASAYKAVMKEPALRQAAYLVSVDRPGYGDTPPRAPVRSLSEQAARVAALLPHLSRPVVIVGHSYGGPLVLQMALDFPDLVDGVLVVAGSVDPDMEETAWYQHVARWPVIRWLVPTDLYVCNEEIMALQPELDALQPRLAQLHQPVTVLQGMRDGLVPSENADYLQRHLPPANRMIVRLPKADHFIPFTQPELVRDAILDLLRKLPSTPATATPPALPPTQSAHTHR